MDTFGDRLKALRLERGLSQAAMVKDMAKRYPHAKISQAWLSTLEKRPTAPREDLLRTLADYYGVGVGYFLGASQTVQINESMEIEIQKLRTVLRRITETGYHEQAVELAEKALDGRIMAIRNGDGYYFAEVIETLGAIDDEQEGSA